MGLNWIVNFYAENILPENFDLIWKNVEKFLLADSISACRENEIELYDELIKPKIKDGKISSQVFILGDYNEGEKILTELNYAIKNKCDFIFSASSCSQNIRGISFDSKKGLTEYYWKNNLTLEV